MPGKDLGTKHTCWKCGTKFYDMRKPAPICPKCGADAREAPVVKQPAGKKARAAPRDENIEDVEMGPPDLAADGDDEEALEEETEELDEDA